MGGAARIRLIVAGALLAMLLAALAGCGGDAPASGAAGEFTPGTPGVLTVATADLPTPGFWEGAAPHPSGGFEHALAERLAERFGLRSVRVVERSFQQIVAGDLGGADLALAQITPTDERAERLDFSTAYMKSPPGVLVRAGTEVPDLDTAQELTWAVERGTTLAGDLGTAIRQETAPLVTDDQEAAVDALRTDDVDAVLLDLPTALAYADQSDGELVAAAQLPSEATLAAALPNDSDNVEAVDSQLRALESDGELDALAERWLGTSLHGTSAADVPLLRTSL